MFFLYACFCRRPSLHLIQSPVIPQLDGNDSDPEAPQSEGKVDNPDAINSDLDDSDDEYDPDAV
ncbi:hypothetical protein RUND412_002382 [Rhizina undulata]